MDENKTKEMPMTRLARRTAGPVILLGVAALAGLMACAPQSEDAESEGDAEASAEPQDGSYLDAVTWPTKFQVDFMNYDNKAGETEGTLYYDATDADALRVKTWFKVCPALPCVEQSWIDAGVACWFYLIPDADLGTASYVLTEGLEQEQYALIGNVAAIRPDFVTCYNAVLPEPPLPAPDPDWTTFVGNPTEPPGVEVQWFRTSGTEEHPTLIKKNAGFYAAIAEPQTEHDGASYKPPYSFGGFAPSEGLGFTHGQLVYGWQDWDLDPSFTIDLSLDGYEQVYPESCPLCLPAQDPPAACYERGLPPGTPPPPPADGPPSSCPICHEVQGIDEQC